MDTSQLLLMKDLSSDQKFMLQAEYKEKSTGTAYLLWFFLGLHYAYLGKWGTQIIFWITLGGLGFWTLIDLFRMKSVVSKVNSEKFNEAFAKVQILGSSDNGKKKLIPKIIEIAGVHIDDRMVNCMNCKKGDEIKLIPDPENKFDKNAIQLHTVEGKMLGFIPSIFSAEITEKLSKGIVIKAYFEYKEQKVNFFNAFISIVEE